LQKLLFAVALVYFENIVQYKFVLYDCKQVLRPSSHMQKYKDRHMNFRTAVENHAPKEIFD